MTLVVGVVTKYREVKQLPMSFKCKDGIVNWQEANLSFLPKKYEKDQLSVFLRGLIAKVKEDHARYQYNRDIKSYAHDIVFIMDLAIKNGYQITEPEEGDALDEINNENKTNSDEDFDFDNIIDG